MPKVLSHTPVWLSRPSPGFQLFQPAHAPKPNALSNGRGKKDDQRGAHRTIAHRGTEIFFVAGNEIRWSDLVLLKDAADSEAALGQGQGAGDAATAEDAAKYSRVLKTPLAGQIKQLVVSPLGDFLAILTSHTVHVAVLPTRFDSPDTGPLRLRTYQLGPTAHVLEQAPVASALWHPLAHLGSCLVTVTTDACVRLWELNRDSRASFDEPALALDLKKLANATSSHEDLRASRYGTSKGFSPDSVEMEVAAACFGGVGSPEEHGWSPMTLWVAMTEGDVYALCPLLPTKWQPSYTTIPSLTTSVVSKAGIIGQDPNSSEDERRTTKQQQKWLSDIDTQEPAEIHSPDGFDGAEVYTRPLNPSAIPKLQGPFQLSPEQDIGRVTDIFVIAPRLEDDEIGEEDLDDGEDFPDGQGLSTAVICLATGVGKVHVCLDLQGVEAQWLPSRRGAFQHPFDGQDEVLELLLLETIDLDPSANDSTSMWPTITGHIANRHEASSWLYKESPPGRYGFYVTLNTGVFSCFLTPWISSLEDELTSPNDSGASFRIGVLHDSEKTEVHQIIRFNLSALATSSHPDLTIPSCISLIDSDLGHFILTTVNNTPQAAVLDTPTNLDIDHDYLPDTLNISLPTLEPRQPYQPSPAFFAASSLPSLLDSVVLSTSSRLKRGDLKSQIRFSPATLQLLTDAHRVLSDETNRLGLAAADLFRRCERMRAELLEQVRRVDDVANRVEAVTGDVQDDERVDGEAVGAARVEQRMQGARERNAELSQRVEGLRRKMAGLGGREPSQRQEAWAGEVRALAQSLGPAAGEAGAENGLMGARLEDVRALSGQLLAQVKEAKGPKGNGDGKEEEVRRRESSRVPPDFRKQKLQQIMQLLERETALVDAVMVRLGNLGGLGA